MVLKGVLGGRRDVFIEIAPVGERHVAGFYILAAVGGGKVGRVRGKGGR